MSRSTVRRPWSETAMPADSWPRCCSAKRPKYVMRATSRCGERIEDLRHTELAAEDSLCHQRVPAE